MVGQRLIILSEISETAKDKYHLIPFIYGVLNSYTDKFIYKTEVDSQT